MKKIAATMAEQAADFLEPQEEVLM